MSLHRTRPRPTLVIPHRKHVEFESPSHLGNLSPDLQPSSPPTFPSGDSSHSVSKVGKYLLTEKNPTPDGSKVYQAVHSETLEEYICKVIPLDKYRDILSPYWQAGDSHEHINEIQEILLGETQAYVFFQCNYGDLHSYIRNKRKLKEGEACQLFQQILSAVDHCHQNGVILRDVKLRKFVFKDQERTELMLDSLEDAYVLEDDTDDRLTDKHGCPAYVSPEILNTSKFYSGRAADMWSLGVMLYTMLIGRYPFHDPEPSVLFGKIRRGQFSIPDTISSRARCLLRGLLRRDPSERLSAEQAMQHPWFHIHKPVFVHVSVESKDQTVPEYTFSDDDASFFS